MRRTLPACCIIVLALCCAVPLSQPLLAADIKPAVKPTKPVTWHVPNAELRVPVKVAVKDALLRMPPQVYLADLKPLVKEPDLLRG